ncbi:MAG: hypothetical protein AAB574_01500 [Patescibacteria group bacterium]
MKKISLLILEIIFLVFLLILLPALLLSETKYFFREGGTYQIALNSGKEYRLVFGHPPNLNSLSLRLKNPLIQNNSRIEINLENNTQQSLAKFVFYGSNVGDPGWVDFDFPPQSGTSYLLKLSTDNTVPESLFLLSDPPGNWDLKSTYKTTKFTNRLNDTLKSFLNRIQKMDKIYLSLYLFTFIGLNWLFIKK